MTQHIFYDTETTGPEPAYDAVLQAAAIKTDDDFKSLEEIDERSRLPAHIIPTAMAMKVTHVDPYEIARARHSAYEFARMLHATFSEWAAGDDTGFEGYNTIRFDEEIMRQMFWQNLLDPYITSGKGRFRSDYLIMLRALYARNPEAIDIPKNEETGKNNFKLENVAPLNGFPEGNAHDALDDVRATIHVARLIRDIDPALYEHMFKMGNANMAKDFIDDAVVFRLVGGQMLNPGILDCCLITSEGNNPKNKSAWNLAIDPTPFLDLSPEEILAAMKKPNTPFRTVKCNKQPPAFPMSWEFLNRVSNDAFEPADPQTIEARANIIVDNAQFQANTAEALRLRSESYGESDTLEGKIYEGFPSWSDKNKMADFHTAPTWEQRLDIVRSLDKPEMRQLGIRTIYLNGRDALPATMQQACADKLTEQRFTLEVGKPWNTVGALMQELDGLLEKDPEDAEMLNVKAWALETYPIAKEWTGTPPNADEVETDDVDAQDAVDPKAPDQADAKAETPTTPPEDKPKVVPAPAGPDAHFLDGLE
jgi:exodeoxyribonuclease I